MIDATNEKSFCFLFAVSSNIINEEEKTFRTKHKSHSCIVITCYGGGECRYVADEKLFTRSSWTTDFPPARSKSRNRSRRTWFRVIFLIFATRSIYKQSLIFHFRVISSFSLISLLYCLSLSRSLFSFKSLLSCVLFL